MQDNQTPMPEPIEQPATPIVPPQVPTTPTPEAPQTPNPVPMAPKPSEPGSGLVIASLASGIAAILFSLTLALNVIAGLAAIVLAIISLIKKVSGRNKIFALVGLVLGIIGVTIGTFTLIRDVPTLLNGSKTIQSADLSFSGKDQGYLDGKKDFAKGETANFGPYTVKVNSFKDNYDYPDASARSKSIYNYIVINITMKNNSDQRKQLSDYGFRLEGEGLDPLRNEAVPPTPKFGDTVVGPGQERTGNIVYKVPKDYTSPLKLTYEYTIYTQSSRSKVLKYSIAL